MQERKCPRITESIKKQKREKGTAESLIS